MTNITRGDEEVVALVIGLERQFKSDGGGAAAGHCRSDDGVVSFIEAVGHVIEVHGGRRLDADRLFIGRPIEAVLGVAPVSFEVGCLGAAVREAASCLDVAGVEAAFTWDGATEEIGVLTDEFAVLGGEFQVLDGDCGDED